MASVIGMGRPAERKNLIVEELRSRIVAGELNPGSRFPTRSEIEKQYGAGPTTVQRALESLRRDGFIRVHSRKGTFVADNPPHLSRYAVVFAHHAEAESLGWFSIVLSRELASGHAQRPDCQLVPYYGVDGHPDSVDFVQLCEDVVNKRIAGLIFASHPYAIRNTPLLNEPNIPRVAFMNPDDFPFPVVLSDTEGFFAKALDDLKSRGFNRVAFIRGTSKLFSYDFLEKLVTERGMETRPYWCLSLDLGVPESARNCAHLMMHCRDSPDSLIICDDNLVEPATAGLVDAGDNVPAEFAVTAHANLPYPTPSSFPARRLGFDIRQILQLCVNSIDAQRRGEPTSPITHVPARFEEELALQQIN